MATKLLSQQNFSWSTITRKMLRAVRDTTAVTAPTSVTTTTASGTSIQATLTAGGAVFEMMSAPVAAGVTISGTITYNVWAKESVATVNASIEGRLYRLSGGVETLISQKSFVTELTTTNAAKNWTDASPTSTAMAIGDRFIYRIYIVNNGTMAAGTVTLVYGGNTSGSSGDTYVQVNEAVTFQQEGEFVQEAAHGANSAGFASLVAAGNTILAYVACTDQSSTVSSVADDNANTYVKLSGPDNWNGTSARGYLFIAKNATGGVAATVTATMGAGTAAYVQLWEISGIDTTSPTDGSTDFAHANSTNPTSGTLTTTKTNTTIFAMADGGSAATAGAGYVKSPGTDTIGTEAKNVAATGSNTANFTASSQNWMQYTLALVAGTQPASGTTYDVSATDSVSLSDSSSGALTVSVSAADSLTLSDSGSGALTLSPSASDAITVSDSLSSQLDASNTVSDSITMSDAATGNIDTVLAAADSITLSDSGIGALTVSVSASDSITLSDSGAVALTISASASDSVTLTDSTTGLLDISAAASDSLTITDFATPVSIYDMDAADAFTLSDSAAGLLTISPDATDSITLTCSASGLLTISLDASDSIVLADFAAGLGATIDSAIPLLLFF